jgi:N-acetylmuramoyl-L-alanine amidase
MNLIVIDAGHGGKDGGAYGKRSKESDIALSVSRKIKNILEPYLTAKLTRAADVFLPLNERPRRANLWGATAFISIHCNASDNKAARGWEVFTTKGQNNSDKLAICIAKR